MFGLKVIGNGVSKWGDMYGSKEKGKEKKHFINGSQADGKKT